MEKNQLKWYDAPVVEVVEMEMSAQLLAGSTNVPGVDVDDDDATGM